MESTANINNNNNTTGIFNEITIQIRYTLNDVTNTENFELYKDYNLEKAFIEFKKEKNINEVNNEQTEKIFYLIKGTQKIKLEKNKTIEELNLKDGDLIEVLYQPPIIIQNELRHNIQNSDSNLTEVLPEKKKKNYILIYIIIGIISLCLIVTLLCVFLVNKKKKSLNNKNNSGNNNKDENEDEDEEKESKDKDDKIILNATEKEFFKEELATNKAIYDHLNTFFVYKSNKIMNLELESESIRTNDEQNYTKIIKDMDFGFLINEKHQEKDEINSLIKNYYTGYLFLLNITINNGTDDIPLLNNKKLYDSISQFKSEEFNNYDSIESLDPIDSTNEINNFRLLDGEEEENQNYDNENGTSFIKIDFYENGQIKNIFTPNDFFEPYMTFFEEIIHLIIPKLSKDLYSDNFNEDIERVNNLINNEDIDEEELNSDLIENYETNKNEEISENLLLENSDNEEIDNHIKPYRRRNSEKEENEEIIENTNSYEIYELKEAEEELINPSNNNDTYHIKGIEENETYSNITEYDVDNVESLQVKLEGSQIKKYKSSFIDENGMLVSIIEYENITIYQPDNESISDLTEEENNLKNEIYNENNQIQSDDLSNEDFNGKNISFNLSSIKFKNSNNVSLIQIINDKEYLNNILKYCNHFTFNKTKITENSDLNLRFLNLKNELESDFNKNNNKDNYAKLEIEHTKLSQKKYRNLQTYSNSYYGLKNFEKEKVIFKYNLIGIILEGTIVTKIEVSTGKTENYFKLTLGFINYKMKFSTVQTNLHIIIKNSNQMTYNFMSLLSQSNEELEKRNIIYSNILIDLEKNVSNLLKESYDYSGLFRESLEDLYDKVKNFSGIFFNELIELIERVYDNYTVILNRAENNAYEIFDNISQITQNEYINYINNMADNILIFKNDTLIFLNNILIEVDEIHDFQLDVLYDIIDVIYDGKLIFKEFIKKLFKAVDKGITSFKYDLRDYIEEIIGDLLYLTDFLSINLNKNEILRNAIEEEIRQNVTIKLKNFRNIILKIMEIINDKIFHDYNLVLPRIKSDKEILIQNCIDDIDNRTDLVVEKIKSKIELIEIYEKYANNIEVINNINNKTYIEFNNEMYYSIIKEINSISPDYLDNSSNIIINRNNLFSLSKDIVDKINLEIKEINEHIELSSFNYISENNYNLDYNLYNFRQYFSDNFLNSLYEDFKLIIKEALDIQYINIIKENYDLAFEYLNEVKSLFNKAPSYRILGNVFINNYYDYKSKFQVFSLLSSSSEFMDYIENNFYNVSNFVLNYINTKIDSINKYYFNESKRNAFYRLDIIEKEIEKISSNLNNYFNELKLETEIKAMILNISYNQILSLENEKSKELDNLYNSIYNKAEATKVYSSSCDVVRLIIRKKRRARRLWRAQYIYDYYCQAKAKTQNNIKKIVQDLSVTKNNLNQSFNNLIENYINKFSDYLNNYINCAQILYDNLYNFTEEKSNNNSNIQIILNDYNYTFNYIINNNTEDKFIEKIKAKNLINNSKVSEILSKFENNIFEIKNDYYQNYYLKDKSDFLEYPEEIIFKLNQSKNNIQTNILSVKNKINTSLNQRIKYIIKSTNFFIKNIIEFHFEYIISRITKETIFSDYFNHKFDFLNNSFTNLLNSIDIEEKGNSDNIFLNNENFGNPANNFINNFTNYLSNLTNEIDNNFTYRNCHELILTDLVEFSDDSFTEELKNNSLNICTTEKYKTNLNYSKYNYNVVKFRTGISNSRKFPELFNSLFDELNYSNIMNSNQIIKIDDIINNKNLLIIYNKTINKLKEIKNEFLSIIQDTFDDFSNEFIKNTPILTSNYMEILNEHLKFLNYDDANFKNNISVVNLNLIRNLNISLNNFNETLFNNFSRFNNSEYDYYSINHTKINEIFNNYLALINDNFNKSIQKISNLKTNNLFYSIPKILLNEIYLERRKKIGEIILNYSNEYDFDSIGFTYDFDNEFDIYLKKYYMEYELNNSYEYFEIMQKNSDYYISQLLENISYIKELTESKYNLIVEQFIIYMKSSHNYVENNYIKEIQINNSKCLDTFTDLNNNISEYLNISNLTELEDYIYNNCSVEIIFDSLINNIENDTCLNITNLNYSNYSQEIDFILDCKAHHDFNYSYIILEGFAEDSYNYLDNNITSFINTLNSNIVDENYLYNYIRNYTKRNASIEINITDYRLFFEDIQDLIFYINNLREPDYKTLMNDTLLDSFNSSYNGNVKSYLTNETINTLNILINYKFDIFIDYFTKKISDDGDYYYFLLNSIDELGNSSKKAIINY